jgi:uncharacterized protein YcgI (DUF1989 family)
MPPYTDKRKNQIMTSRALHKDNYNDYNRRWMKTKYENSWKAISRVFMHILISEIPKKKYPQKSKSKKPVL